MNAPWPNARTHRLFQVPDDGVSNEPRPEPEPAPGPRTISGTPGDTATARTAPTDSMTSHRD
ncbi:hypothetical protein [Streptomyces sp. NPDC087437]|uniref:hypothetical protein n=1 Tax=Streptomyces sp. NPDC087437 TaxID=3365789 RepID=UPI0037F53804